MPSETWFWIFGFGAAAAFLLGIPIGILHQKKSEDIRFRQWKQDYHEADVRKRQAMLYRNNRRIPAREGAGPPVVVRKMQVRRRAGLR